MMTKARIDVTQFLRDNNEEMLNKTFQLLKQYGLDGVKRGSGIYIPVYDSDTYLAVEIVVESLGLDEFTVILNKEIRRFYPGGHSTRVMSLVS